MSRPLCILCGGHATGTDELGNDVCARCAADDGAAVPVRVKLPPVRSRPAAFVATVRALPPATRDAATCFIRCGEERAAGRCPAPDSNGAERCARCPVRLAFPDIEQGDP